MAAPRVLISIVPPMYAEALAFSLRKHRPGAEVSVIGPSDDLEAEVLRPRPHLIVANRVPPGGPGPPASGWRSTGRWAARGRCFLREKASASAYMGGSMEMSTRGAAIPAFK